MHGAGSGGPGRGLEGRPPARLLPPPASPRGSGAALGLRPHAGFVPRAGGTGGFPSIAPPRPEATCAKAEATRLSSELPGGPCRAQPRAPRPAPPSPAAAAPSARVPARGWQRPRHRRSLVFPAAGEHLDLCDLPSALPLPYGFIPQPLLLKRDSFRQHSSGSPAPGFRCLNPACATERDVGGRAARWGPSACAGGAGRAAGTCPS